MKRDNFPRQWEDAGLSSVGIKMLDLQMKQHIMIIDNIDRESQTSKTSLQLKAREQVLQKMQEQIQIRDNLIKLAEKHFVDNHVEVTLDDPKLVNIEEIVKINSSLPPIAAPSNPYNFSSKKMNSAALKPKYKSRLTGNASLPPVPSNRDYDESDSSNQNKKILGFKRGYNNNVNPYGAVVSKGKVVNKNIISWGNSK